MKKILFATLLVIFYHQGYTQTYQRLYTQNQSTGTLSGALVADAQHNKTAFFLKRSLNIADSTGTIIASTQMNIEPSAMLGTTDGGFVFASKQSQTPATITKTDSVGNVLWQVNMFDTVNMIYLMRVDNSGNTYFFIDSTYSFSLIRKYNAAGSLLWSKKMNYPHPMALNLNAAGNCRLLFQSLNQMSVRQLDANGDSLWQRNYPILPNNIIDFTSDTSGGYTMLGIYQYSQYISSIYYYNYYVAKLYQMDATGLFTDSVALPGFYNSPSVFKLNSSADGSVILYTSAIDTVTRQVNATLTDVSTFGQIRWQRSFLGDGHETAFDICPLANGFVLSGDTAGRAVYPYSPHNSAVFIDRLNLSGLYLQPTIVDTALGTYSATNKIDTNDIAATLSTNGNLFYPLKFVAPNPGNSMIRTPSAIFDAAIWVAGKNNGSLYSSSEMYFCQYQAGPSHTLPQDAEKWNTIWSISRTDVLSVKNDFDQHHAITLPVPASVLSWPAKGNGSATGNGNAPLIITQDMAPFMDRNGDGVYNIYDGDYPLIKGDKMLWWINNDAGSQSQNPMGVERRYSFYEYNSLTDSNLNNTLFLSVTIKNQSGRAYDSVLIGAFVDFDLGCAYNDRVGCIPVKNTFYVYNGYVGGGTQLNGVTCDEGIVCPTSEIGYGCSNPILSATFLNDSMRCFNRYTNSGGVVDDPLTDQNYYGSMNGRWNDGSPVTYGGNGYGDSIPYPYAFPGNPADPSQWSECNDQTTNPMAPGDRKAMAAIGPFSLAAGDTISFDLAFIFHPGPYDNCPDLSDSSDVSQHIDSIVRYYQTERFAHWYDSTKSLTPGFYNVGINETAIHPSFTLIPNPNNGSFNIHIANPGQSDYTVSVTDMLGRVVYSSAMHAPDQTVRLDDATSGVYSVSIENRNYRETRKVVITR
jgi:hypothetical protein